MQLITALAITSTALLGAPSSPPVTPYSADGECMRQAAASVTEYASTHDGISDAIYYTCTAGVGAAWTPDERGKPESPLVVGEARDESRSSAASDGPDISDFECTIAGVWEVQCDWRTYYQKWTESGGVPTLVWERSVSSRAILHLQQLSHLSKLRYTHDQGYEFDAMGDTILQRQQGLLAPTFENSSAFYADGGTQASTDSWVVRTTSDTGKYSIIWNMTSLYDVSEGVYIPIFGDPTSPRFQCYATSSASNCEYPGGEEAGVF